MKEIKRREVSPKAIVGAAIVMVLLLGVLWYHFLGSGTSGSELPTRSAHEMPLNQVPPNIRAMFEPKGGNRGGAMGVPR